MSTGASFRPQPFSLSHALRALARDAGVTLDFDDVNAVLGLSFMLCAVPGEPDVSRWSMYARDAFLIEGARALGFTIRPVHPPETARGLSDADEFAQHFDASYRPIILRALENRQRVLAWRGWAAPHGLLWGTVTEPCDDGTGFRGRVYVDDAPASPDAPALQSEPRASVPPAKGDHRGSSRRQSGARADVRGMETSQLDTAAEPTELPCTLTHPAVQLHVVESGPSAPARPEPLAPALAHAGALLDNTIGGPFGVVTGPKAYDEWLKHTGESPEDSKPPGTSLGELSRRAEGIAGQHAALASATVAAHESAVRFLRKHLAAAPVEEHSRIATLERECQNIVMTLTPLCDATRVGDWLSSPQGRGIIAAKITTAREATQLMRTALIRLE